MKTKPTKVNELLDGQHRRVELRVVVNHLGCPLQATPCYPHLEWFSWRLGVSWSLTDVRLIFPRDFPLS